MSIDYGGQTINLAPLNVAALDDLIMRITAERRRRHVLANAQAEAVALSREYATAVGRKDGDPWVQPTGAHDAYAKDAKVTHGGKTWVSLTHANVWEPGVSAWREDVATGNEWPQWVQPTGAHDAYKLGDKVMFNGQRYISAIAANTWSPAAYPAGWIAQGAAAGVRK